MFINNPNDPEQSAFGCDYANQIKYYFSFDWHINCLASRAYGLALSGVLFSSTVHLQGALVTIDCKLAMLYPRTPCV